VAAGLTDRHVELSHLLRRLPPQTATVSAEQIHGGSIAVIGGRAAAVIPGADALLTDAAGVALLVRTADCLPLWFADPARGAVGIAHVGWRGLAAGLPARVVAAFHRVYRSRPQALAVAIGPAIRVCCYEVGPAFDALFGLFVQRRGGRRLCDLAGAAVAQLEASGVAARRILDTRQCTACGKGWWSLRREGPGTGRLISLILRRS